MNELKEKRKELGLTQIQAALSCGVSRRTYQSYEENENRNSTYDELYQKLSELGLLDGSNFVANVRHIKRVCNEVLSKDYPEVQAAYLFGSYARGEATGKSDIDLLIVCPPMGMKFYKIAADLKEQLHKNIDLHTHRQLVNNEQFLENVLKDGIKIYGRNSSTKNRFDFEAPR